MNKLIINEVKKPKFWDLKKPNFYSYILFPITILVKFVNYLNIIFNKPNLNKANIKTVCIGNFYIGGTGKTSLSIKINNILKNNKVKSCFIKRIMLIKLMSNDY